MNQHLEFARFDIVNLATQPRQLISGFIFVVLIAAASPFSELALPAAGLLVSLMAATTFALDERGHLDTLYATLPVPRVSVVVGRYLTILALWIAVTAVAVVAAVVAPLLRGLPLRPGLLGLLLVVSFGIVAVTVSLVLPFFFALGYTRARPAIYITAALVAGAAYLAARLGLIPQGFNELSVTSLPAGGTVVIGLVVLALSARIATGIYRRRQF